MHKAYQIYKTATCNHIYRIAQIKVKVGWCCPVCQIGYGCNTVRRRIPKRSWKEKRKTQYNIY